MPSLLTLWTALADALDDRETVDIGLGGDTTHATISLLINATTGATSTMYEGRWLYNQTKVTQSRIAAYAPTTGIVTNTPAVTAHANLDVAHITSLFPVLHRGSEETDYHTLVNRALGRMSLNIESEVAVTLSDIYPMTSFPSLDRPERLVQVREPNPFSASRAPIPSMWRGWEVVPDPPTASLRTKTPFGVATGNVTLERIVPASCWIAVPTTFAESAVGLVNESDQAQPSVEEFLPFGLTEALPVLIARSPGRPNAEWLTLLAQAQDAVAKSRYRDRTQQVEQTPATPAARTAA